MKGPLSGRQAGRQMDALINERAGERAGNSTASFPVITFFFLQRFARLPALPLLPPRLPFVAVPFLIVALLRRVYTLPLFPSLSRFLPMGSVNPPPPLGEVEAPKATDYPGVSLTINEEGGRGEGGRRREG